MSTKKITILSILLCLFLSIYAQKNTYDQRREILIEKYMNYGISKEWAERRAEVILKNENQLRSLSRGDAPESGSIAINRNQSYLNYSPEELLKKIFLKSESDAQIFNVTFNGTAWNGFSWTQADRSLVYFSDGGGTPLKIGEGLLLSTGPALLAEGPNGKEDGLDGGVYLMDDDDLADLANYFPLGTGSVLEFDFIPSSSEVSFEYSFASEEYSEFVTSPFGDVFGFFISGPGISGTQNMALVPNTNVPVSIETINNGYTETNTQYSYPGTSPSNPSYFVAN